MKLNEIIELNGLVSNLSLDTLDTKKSIKTYKLLSSLKETINMFEEGRKSFMTENNVPKHQNGGWDLLELRKMDKETFLKVTERLDNEATEDLDEEITKDLISKLNYLTYKEFEELVKTKKVSSIITGKEGAQEKVEKDIIFNAEQKSILYKYLVSLTEQEELEK